MLDLVAAATATFVLCLTPPIDAPVTRGFEPPPCEYCAGHRTIEFGDESDFGDKGVVTPVEVRAPVDGRVRFAGPVAGTAYVSFEPIGRPGRTVTVGWIPPDPGVFIGLPALGGLVRVGDPIGRSAGGATLSLRSMVGEYQDPTPYLGRLRYRPRLVPLDGRARRPRNRAVCQPLR
jgi:hypothetical protein